MSRIVRSPALLAGMLLSLLYLAEPAHVRAQVDRRVAATKTELVFKAGTNLHQSLDGNVGITWGAAPLRSSLEALQRGQAFAVWLDRRVDPDQRIQFAAKDERLEVALLRLAGQQKMGLCVVGSAIYLGPPETTKRLATIAAVKRWEVSQAVPSAAARLAQAKEVFWEAFATPRELIAETAKAYGVQIRNLDEVPHDLWPAANLPPVNFADRLTLQLAGFGLSFQMQPGSLQAELIPLPDLTSYTAVHPYKGDAAKAIAAITKLDPQLKPERADGGVRLTASYEQHEKVDRLLRGDSVRTTKVAPPQKRYSLKVEGQPAGAVAKTMAADLGKELKFTPEVREKLQGKVSFQVTDATLEELLAAALTPLGLNWRIDETALEILPAE